MPKVRIGDSPLRTEDRRFLVGEGRYVDDLPFANLAYLYIIRSPHAHAEIRRINSHAAERLPGVMTILKGTDQSGHGILPMEPYVRHNSRNGEPFSYISHPPLAINRVRYVGQPVAMIVARSLMAARDAAEAMEVEYEPLSAVISIEAALASSAPRVSENIPGNAVLQWQVGDENATERAFQTAAHVTKLRLTNHRIIANSLEPRGGVGYFNQNSSSYTLHTSSQSLHTARDCIAETMGVSNEKVRVIAPDVGGGFGVKNNAYAEHVLVLWAARIAGCPVKWINDRTTSFVSDHQARDHLADAELALDGSGRFLALRVASWANLGAYLCGSSGRVCTDQYASLPGTVYEIPEICLSIGAVTTHTVPIGVTRGPGFAEANNILERLIDLAARETSTDRADLRRRNMRSITPFISATGTYVDSGKFSAILDIAMETAKGFEHRKLDATSRSKLRGLGFAYHIKATGGAPEEKVELCFDNDTLTLTTGTQSIGQGHETTFPQIISELLGVSIGSIRYRQADTGLISKGGGHGSSRATYMGGTAIFLAIEKIIEKGKPIAAQMLQVAETDIYYNDGFFRTLNSERIIDIFSVAETAREIDQLSKGRATGLDTSQEFIREHMTFPNGCHVAEVEIDPDTGKVDVVRYSAVDDYGKIINPAIASGQVHGAIVQGIGQALLEHAVYEETSGQLLSGSLLDYALPRADDVPDLNLTFSGIDCSTNPLGVKGCGEAGAIAGYPAVGNAIGDALASVDIRSFEGPATPERVWRALQRPPKGETNDD